MDENKELKVSETSTEETPQTEQPMNREFVDKVLREKKNTALKNMQLQQEMENLKLKIQESEEKELLREKKFEQLFQQKSTEVEQWKNKYTDQTKVIVDATKTGALKSELSKLGINQDRFPHVMKLVDLNQIQYDNDSRTVLGAEEIARDLAATLPEWFGTTKIGVNQEAPKQSFGPLTIEKWRELPESERNKPEVIAQLRASMGAPYKR